MQALLPDFRRVTEAYFGAVKGVGSRLQQLISLALHLPPDYFDPFFTKPMVYLRPLHYAPRKSDPGKVRSTLLSVIAFLGRGDTDAEACKCDRLPSCKIAQCTCTGGVRSGSAQ